MKTLRIVSILSIFILYFSVCNANPEKKKDARPFNKVLTLVDSHEFTINVDYAYPSGGRSVSLASNGGTIVMKGDSVQGHLPFFGRAYSLPYGDSGSIEFDNKKVDSSMKVDEQKQQITYKFSVAGRSDIFRVQCVITASGKCNVSVTSNSKTPISYSGDIQEVETR